MTERRRPLSDADFDQALTELGARLIYPRTPDLAAGVRRRLTAQPGRRGFRIPPVTLRRGLALAALVVVVAIGLISLSPGVRSAIADRLGLKGVRISVVPTLPPIPSTPAPSPSATPRSAAGTPSVIATTPSPAATPAGLGGGLQLGKRVSLGEAQAGVGYAILAPSLPDLAPPDEVWLSQNVPGGQVAFVYAVRPGLPQAAQTGLGMLVTEFRGDIEPNLFGKLIPPGTRLEPVTVNGGRGWWIEGNPHAFFYRNANGQVHDEQLRLAGNTLLWEQNGLTLRLESALSKDEALRIAESVR